MEKYHYIIEDHHDFFTQAPSRKLLAIAGALSVVAGSFAAVPATFAANVSASVPGGNSQNSTGGMPPHCSECYPVPGLARPVPAGILGSNLLPLTSFSSDARRF